MSCITRIKETNLTETEKEIAQYIIEHPELVLDDSAMKLGEKTHSSSAAIVRFAKKLGYSGFPQLKIELAKDLVEQIPEVDNLLHSGEDMVTLMNKAHHSQIVTIDKTYQLLSASTLEDVVKALEQAKHIYLFGVGGSAIVCDDFRHKLMRIGKASSYYPDIHLQMTFVPTMTQEDLAIFVSYSGETKGVVTASKWAKEMHIPSVAITQSAYNKLGKLVDHVLTIPSQEQALRIGAMSSRYSSLIIIDLLYYGLVKRNKEEYAHKIINTRRIIQEMEK